ncbi:unnamed protein product [Nippostrongylus brasiliensis]|uniref:Hva1_TUDOR domain-containing protein n=1 Tax=Nippostrongylus brasiliensis TaxID=27835 RepID=A0A0N4Y6X7_NIPBR|nr:unnamed protein product [Nippostrongylus brasiliensis]
MHSKGTASSRGVAVAATQKTINDDTNSKINKAKETKDAKEAKDDPAKKDGEKKAADKSSEGKKKNSERLEKPGDTKEVE